jgi:ABC-type multidrug transport system ATPase subunit/pSer/pThr/pTyr-binding forkhead associated (FHA) protein
MSASPSPAKLTIKLGPGVGRVIELPQATWIIGRIAPADLLVEFPEVSKKHARLSYRDGKYLVEDLGSSNGTYLNGQPLQGAQELKDRDEISLGQNVVFLFNQPQVSVSAQSVQEMTGKDLGSKAAPRNEKTMLDVETGLSEAAPSEPSVPPSLQVTVAGQEPQTFTLTKKMIALGRAEENDIVIPSMIVSRHHAVLNLTRSGYEIEIIPGATNTLTCQGRAVTTNKLLADGDVLRIDSDIPGMMVSMTYLAPLQAAARLPFIIKFGEKDQITFGRDAQNDVVLDMPNVSRFHAQVTRVGRRYYITDLHSVNGTYVNDKRITGDVWLNPQDTIRISQYRLVMGEDQFTRFDETEGLKIEAFHLNKWVKKDLNLLQDISLTFQPRELIVVVGQSGGGKSTLLDAIAGYRPATHGNVYANGIDIYRNFDAIRNEIGYVPQRDIIHMELTVYQALNYAAQLRMPKDTSPEERHKRIMEVLDDLDLAHRKDLQVSGLSGGQQKRVSIGVELLTRPGLFFLDEPTSGLDPGTETAFMHLMRRLADQGRTIILVTHATKNVMLADKVVFLARGGYLAWFGPPDAALAYFDQYRSETERRTRTMEFDQIYSILDDPTKGKASDWAECFKAHPAFEQYIAQPLKLSDQSQLMNKPAQAVKQVSKKGSALSSFHQFIVLSKRNMTILRRDRSSLVLMLAAAPAVAALDLILAPVMGNAPFSFLKGDAANGGITLFLVTIYALLVGGMSQMREFVKEADIYKRERLVNLRILPYVSSKILVALPLAFWHALAYTIFHYIAFRMPGGIVGFFQVYVTLVLAVMTGMMLGLVASALARNSASAPLTMIMLIVPLIVLSGALAPIPPALSQIASTRWAFQGLLGIVGVGSDVAADPCWYLSKDLRDAMTLDDKTYQQCRCMGVQVFNENTCSFPGVGAYYVPELAEAVPTEPTPLPDAPPEPVMPPAPTPPADKYDQIQMAEYLNALSSYQDQAQAIQDDYRNSMDLYKVQADIYKSQMTQYLEDLARYNISRASAVSAAEGVINSVNEKYGWAWVNKRDPLIYIPWLLRTWFAQFEIMVVYFFLILFLIKRKDVK